MEYYMKYYLKYYFCRLFISIDGTGDPLPNLLLHSPLPTGDYKSYLLKETDHVVLVGDIP